MTLPDIDALATYGGALTSYAPITDPNTDRDASAENQAYASVAAMTHTARLAWARFVGNATTPTLSAADAVWGVSVQPTPSRSALATYLITWPSTVTDELGVVHTLNLRWAKVSVEGSTAAFAQCAVTSPNVVTVYTFNTSFAANDLVGTTLFVQAG